MKIIALFTLLVAGLARASELQVNFNHSLEGAGHFTASVYEIVYPGDTEAPLWDFVMSLQEKLYTSEDGTFSFLCAQSQVTKGVYESRCSIEVKSLDRSGHVAASQSRWATLLTSEATSPGFKHVFAPTDALIKINLKEKFKIREIVKNDLTYFYLTFEK